MADMEVQEQTNVAANQAEPADAETTNAAAATNNGTEPSNDGADAAKEGKSPKRRKPKSKKDDVGDDGLRKRKSSRKRVKCKLGHVVKVSPKSAHMCDQCMRAGTYARCMGDCDYDLCATCYAKKGGSVPKEVLEEEAGEVAEDPFMGWEGWPPKSVVIVTIVLGIIFEIVFCIGFWQFWTSGDSEEDPTASAGSSSGSSGDGAGANTTVEDIVNTTLNATNETVSP